MKKCMSAISLFFAASIAIAAPETYIIDTNHSMPRFSYNHLGYSMQLSRFDKISGKIVIDKTAKTGAVDVTIDTTSVNTGSSLFNEHTQAEEFFDTVKHPTATFKSTKMNFKDDKPASVDGTLTIKGISKPVTLNVSSFMCMPHPMKKKDACGANASVVVKRSDFNMGKHAPYVSDEVTVDLPIEAIKE
ncbi:MAG TPA: YceI family protein [Methylophilus sp.]|nr:YceI family protein [Methylophilus sp.]HQQ33610.1 YceI family protein [Methylophilus sp.]